LFIAAGSGAWSQTAAPKVAAVPTGGKTWNILTLPLVEPQIPIAVAFARTFKDALEAAAPGPVMLLAGTLTR
jgi:hypothetical protein